MKIKLDENMPLGLCDDLRALGHEVDTVQDEGLTGVPDSLILSRIRAEGRILWTMDKGIADVRQYPPHLYAGIVLFRAGVAGRGMTRAFVLQHIEEILALDLSGKLLVITGNNFRLR